MPVQKKKKGGKKGKGKGDSTEKRLLLLKEDMQEYAKIMKCLGDRRITVILPDSSEMIAQIPGRYRKRVWMTPGDIILVSRRDFQDNKLDVIHKYNLDEIRSLHKTKEIPEFFLDMESTQDIDELNIGMTIGDDDDFDFENL